MQKASRVQHCTHDASTNACVKHVKIGADVVENVVNGKTGSNSLKQSGRMQDGLDPCRGNVKIVSVTGKNTKHARNVTRNYHTLNM